MEMKFTEYLESKKIDPSEFEKQDPNQFQEWATIFECTHTQSFTMQKMNIINAVRRKYPLKIESDGQAKKRPVAKPVVRPKK